MLLLPLVMVSIATADAFSDGWGILHARYTGNREPLIIGLIDSERGLFAPIAPSTAFFRDPLANSDDFIVSPDHRYILQRSQQFRAWQIYHPETDHLRDLVPVVLGINPPLWSPDSQYLFVSGTVLQGENSGEGAYLYKMGDTGIEAFITIASQEQMNNTIQPIGQTAVWSADSTQVIFAAYALNEFHDLVLYDVTTGELQIVATDPDTPYDNLVLLPGGDEVAYMATGEQAGTSGLVNIRDGSSRNYNVPLIPNDVYWSPDGAFYAAARSREVQVWAYGETFPYNTEIDLITSGYVLRWSPDGEEIAFTDWPDNQIYVMNRDGSELRQVTSGEADYMMIK